MTLDKALNSKPVSISNIDAEATGVTHGAMMSAAPLQTVTPMMTDAIDRQVLMVSADCPLSRAIATMGAVQSNCGLTTGSSSSRHASCTLIVENEQVIGIFTERDIVRLTAKETKLDSLTVADVMTSPVKTLQESAFQDIFAVLFLFRRYRIRHLPIVDEQNRPI
ncbi:MAG: CBS domain-containing protein, partial [Leptolyngbyaceae cyanobacterium MAG.088]|nr:CBS domain-containing protein [Leptolyngbyaceae cyanobacterium MAG.088]